MRRIRMHSIITSTNSSYKVLNFIANRSKRTPFALTKTNFENKKFQHSAWSKAENVAFSDILFISLMKKYY